MFLTVRLGLFKPATKIYAVITLFTGQTFDHFIYHVFLVFLKRVGRRRTVKPADSSPKCVMMMSFEVEQSFRNIVRYYAYELYMIDRGHKATRFFNDRQRKSLTKYGVFEKIYVHRGCRLKISEKAKAILNSIDVSSISLTDLI